MADGIPYPPSATALRFGSYAPGQQYRGDLYIGEGIAGLGSAVAQGIQQYEQNKRVADQRDATFDFLKRNYPDTVPPEAFDAYHDANANQKNKWMMQAYTGYMDKIRQDKEAREQA